jgi:hypothetical protein
MLKDVNACLLTSRILSMISNIVDGHVDYAQTLRSGVFLINHFGSSDLLKCWEHRPEFPDLDTDEGSVYRGAVGVCDNADQVLRHYPELEASERQFIVTLTAVNRDTQPRSGGWRWYKWGAYIGTQNPENDYLYDDTHIDRVYVFHIYEYGKETYEQSL